MRIGVPYVDSGKGTGETALLRQLEESINEGDIIVADSYYCTYWLIAMCRRRGAHLVMKHHHRRDDEHFDAICVSKTERTIKWQRSARPKWMSKKDYRRVPEFIEMRLSDVIVEDNKTRTNKFTVATTMLNTETYSSDWIAALYQGRWFVEPDIESFKCTMGVEHLRSQSPEGIERERWTAILSYNLVRLKMLQSGYAAGREIRSMSFTETYQLLSTNWLLCACTGVGESMATSAEAQSVCAIVGSRPGRVEPRENKRRPKTITLMTIPRRKSKAELAAASQLTNSSQ